MFSQIIKIVDPKKLTKKQTFIVLVLVVMSILTFGIIKIIVFLSPKQNDQNVSSFIGRGVNFDFNNVDTAFKVEGSGNTIDITGAKINAIDTNRILDMKK